MAVTKTDKKISCIILAGGKGKRVGGVDKGLLEYKNKPLIAHIINTIAPQVDDIIISANRNIERYKNYAKKVISDESAEYLGPLAGIDAALPHCGHDWVLVVACDTPFLPADIIDKFLLKQTDSNLYIAESGNKLQLVLLLHKTLHDSIKHSLHEGQLRLMQWVKSQQPETVNFQDSTAFKNFNYNEDFDA
ncbi:MAG: molybdenum cofactor guanylyltransferase [Gammaproteobacteria bacterium]|nr:molybdenum cofactor guanylyltransferase [Gammaproteobacteria bacterium]